jgi:hypothetical protein
MWYRVVKASFGVSEKTDADGDTTVAILSPENLNILNPGRISIVNSNIDDEVIEATKPAEVSPENLTTEEQLRMNFPENEGSIRNTLNPKDSDINMFKGEGLYLALRNKGVFTDKSAPSSQSWV